MTSIPRAGGPAGGENGVVASELQAQRASSPPQQPLTEADRVVRDAPSPILNAAVNVFSPLLNLVVPGAQAASGPQINLGGMGGKTNAINKPGVGIIVSHGDFYAKKGPVGTWSGKKVYEFVLTSGSNLAGVDVEPQKVKAGMVVIFACYADGRYGMPSETTDMVQKLRSGKSQPTVLAIKGGIFGGTASNASKQVQEYIEKNPEHTVQQLVDWLRKDPESSIRAQINAPLDSDKISLSVYGPTDEKLRDL